MAGVFDTVRERIDDRIEKVKKPLCNGEAGSFNEYQASCGCILGLTIARNMITDTMKEMSETEWEDSEDG